jgi:hypothetical protein
MLESALRPGGSARKKSARGAPTVTAMVGRSTALLTRHDEVDPAGNAKAATLTAPLAEIERV